MNKHITSVSIAIILFSSLCVADVFKHRQSGEVFYGYPTNKSQGPKTRVYVEQDGKFTGKTILIDEYDITYSPKGRKANLIVIGIDHQDILLSGTVSRALAKTIIEGANKGPRAILLDIDSPGGLGDCMKQVCDAIKKTANCPVIAFISGKKYGGAFSAAAGIALACDTIYIAPDAQMGTIAPQVSSGSRSRRDSITDWQATFTPEGIDSFGGYLSSLAKTNNRPGALASAIVDRGIVVVEVVTDEQGSRNIIDQADKQPLDAIVKTWSKKMPVNNGKRRSTNQDDSDQQSESQISISADEAIYTRMADAIARSRNEVIEALEASDTKLVVTTRIKSEVRKFSLGKANASRFLSEIAEFEEQAIEIENEIKDVQTEYRKHRPTREDERLKRLQQEMYRDQLNGRRIDGRVVRSKSKRSRARNSMSDNEIANIEQNLNETYINPYMIEYERLTYELAYVLDELIARYQRVGGIARQYPNALPEGTSFRQLEQKLNTAGNKRDTIGYY